MHRRQRAAYYTELAGSEGAHDEVFLRLLKLYYLNREGAFKIEIMKGYGKAQTEIVRNVVRRPGAYDKRIVVMDNDKDCDEMKSADKLAKDHDVLIFRNTPCIEGVLVKILEPEKKIGGMKSQALKDYFETTYIPREKRNNIEAYKKVFPKSMLDEARNRVPDLEVMIRIMEKIS